MNRLSLAGAAALVVAACAACGGSTLPGPEPCPTPSPTPRADGSFAVLVAYFRTVETGEVQLRSFLDQFRGQYPEGVFYRSSGFREDFVQYAGASNCVLDGIEALRLPPGATADQEARDAELDSVVAEYRRVLERGVEAVRQRNTSDYRDFDRNIDTVQGRLGDWVARGFN